MASLLTPPWPGPWDTTRDGGVKDADGGLIGYCRYDRVGDLARMQAASRWWAASPALVDAAIALSIASHRLLKAGDADARVTAEAAVIRARAMARDAIGRLTDPSFVATAQFNAPVHDLLGRLPEDAR